MGRILRLLSPPAWMIAPPTPDDADHFAAFVEGIIALREARK